MLVLSRKQNERIVIYSGDHKIVVNVAKVSGRIVTIGVIAPQEVRIIRGELLPQDEQEAIHAA